VVCSCGASVGGDVPNTPDGNDLVDADEQPPPDALELGPFGAPVVVPGADSAAIAEDDGTLSNSGLELVFAGVVAGDNDRKHLFILTRASTQVPFAGPATRLPFSINGATYQTPRFSQNDKSLFFASNRDPIASLTKVAGIDEPDDDDKWFAPCGGNRYLMISARGGDEDIYEGRLGMTPPTRVAELSSPQGETGTFLTEDCLTVYFASTRSGNNRIYTATRAAVDQPWPVPTEVLDFMPGAMENQQDPWISADGRTFVLASDRLGTRDVFMSTR
jgi:Tol biopolymer transport system component